MNEIKLVKKAKKGDDTAFEELICLYKDQLYRTAYLYVQNKEDALDVVQETAYKAYLSLGQLKNSNYFKTWLIRILIHNANELLRAKKKVVKFEEISKYETNEGPTNQTNQMVQNIDLKTAIQQLDERYQTVVILYYYHDLAVHQIAWYMHIPEGTVKTYLHRARKSLKKLLEGSDQTWINSNLKMK